MKRVATAVALLVAALLASPGAWAQRSGGRSGGSRSFGGSRSNSGGGSSYGGSRSYGGSTSYGSSSSRPSSYYAPPRPYVPPPRVPAWSHAVAAAVPAAIVIQRPATQDATPAEFATRMQRGCLERFDLVYPHVAYAWLYALLAYAPLAALSLFLTRQRAARPIGRTSGRGRCELRRVSVAIDWTARERVQYALAAAARTDDLSTEVGMFSAALRARGALVGALDAVRYATFRSLRGAPQEVERALPEWAGDLRSRYAVETVTNGRTVASPGGGARTEEGRGFVVVSLIVGLRGNLAALPERVDADAVRDVLARLLPADAADLVALETIWSPSDGADRLSSAELEVLYPELDKLPGGGPIGRVQCGSCRAVYAAELGRCPACGAG